MTTKKKKSIEEFLSFAPPPERDYVTAPEYLEGKPILKPKKDGSHSFKSSEGNSFKKDASGKETAELQPIGVDGSVPEAQAPRPLKELLPPVVGEPPEMAPKYSAPVATPAPVAPTLDIPQASGPSGWERFLVGATPALVGLLSGNELEGVKLSGETLANTEADIYKRERDFNGKLAEMKAKKALGSTTSSKYRKPSYATKELFDPKTGKTYVHSIVDGQDAGALGEAAPDKVRDSYMKEVMRNPETGKMEVAVINPKTKEVTFHGEANIPDSGKYMDLDFQGEPTKAYVKEGKVQDYVGKLPAKENKFAGLEEGRNKRFASQKEFDAFKSFTSPTGNFNKTKENIDGLVSAATQLNAGNPRANAGIANYLARNVYGEKGPLSDSDIARLSGDPSYGAVVNRWLDAKLSGKLGELDRSDIRQIIDISYQLQKTKALSEASRYSQGFAAMGFDPSPSINAYVNNAFKPLPAHVNLQAGNRSLPKAGSVQQGYKFKGGDPADKKNWEKQ